MREPGHVAIVGACPCGLACGASSPCWATTTGRSTSEVPWPAATRPPSSIPPASRGTSAGTSSSATSEVRPPARRDHGRRRARARALVVRPLRRPLGSRIRSRTTCATCRRRRRIQCLLGLIEAPGVDGAPDFAGWIDGTFGAGIAQHFMRPYNTKSGRRRSRRCRRAGSPSGSVVDHRRALRNVLFGEDDLGWGPNNTFRFPRRRNGRSTVASPAPSAIACATASSWTHWTSSAARSASPTAPSGSTARSSRRCRSTASSQRSSTARRRCARPRRRSGVNGVWMVGVGSEQPLRDDRSWLYFPDEAVPFYRVTNFAKYAAANVRAQIPPGTRRSSPRRPTHRAARVTVPRSASRSSQGSGASGCSTRPRPSPPSTRWTSRTPTRCRRRPRPGARGRAALADGALGVLARPLRVLAVRDGQHGHAAKMGIDVARFLVEGRPEELWTG